MPSGISWQRLPKVYVCALTFLMFVLPGVIVAFTNVYVFICAKKDILSVKRNHSG